ncbi:MAG TPA: cell envelope integrity EipB family protein [Stellaceae bacterium]|nr:cell envelope integrity EipB family protein [Stellaceae bacterium]
MTLDRLVDIVRPAAVLCVLLLAAGAARTVAAAEIMPHRALYTMSLGRASGDAGVVAASGTMAYRWGQTCDGWTVEQRYRLKMGYADTPDVAVASNFVTWESRDGLRYRFNQKETRNGATDEEIRGSATLDGPGKGGTAVFEKPEGKSFHLPPGVLFPSAHTIFLIDRAKAGATFIAKQIFDGASVDNAVLVSAVIGPKIEPDAAAARKSPLLNRPGWRVRLAFFPSDPKIEKPDYELGMLLLDNGVSRNMVIDYGDYAITATLDDIEAVPKPKC